MVCYIDSDDVSTIGDVVTAIIRWPQGANLLVTKAFNVDLSKLGYHTCGGDCHRNIGGAGGASIWVVYIGYVPTHRKDARRFLPSGGTDTEGADAAA